MPSFNIPRTSQTAIAFEGELLAHVSGKDIPSVQKNPRWHEINLYRTASGKYVAHVAFKCDSRYDNERDDVQVCKSPDEIVTFLNSFNPTTNVRGWPHDKHKQQDDRLREKLTEAVKTLATQALAQTSEFSERI